MVLICAARHKSFPEVVDSLVTVYGTAEVDVVGIQLISLQLRGLIFPWRCSKTCVASPLYESSCVTSFAILLWSLPSYMLPLSSSAVIPLSWSVLTLFLSFKFRALSARRAMFVYTGSVRVLLPQCVLFSLSFVDYLPTVLCYHVSCQK